MYGVLISPGRSHVGSGPTGFGVSFSRESLGVFASPSDRWSRDERGEVLASCLAGYFHVSIPKYDSDVFIRYSHGCTEEDVDGIIG